MGAFSNICIFLQMQIIHIFSCLISRCFFIKYRPLLIIIAMAFTLDREGAALRLGVSSRTIDRHIQAGRIRTRRIGKKTFLDDADVEALREGDSSRRNDDYIVILDEKNEASSHEIVRPEQK